MVSGFALAKARTPTFANTINQQTNKKLADFWAKCAVLADYGLSPGEEGLLVIDLFIVLCLEALAENWQGS